jgi:hypothetical protein
MADQPSFPTNRDTDDGDRDTREQDLEPHGSLDGSGAGDHDEPFSGFQSYQFSTRQRARLLQLRGELLEARLGHGRWAHDLAAAA